MFTKYDSRGYLTAYLVCHVGDILFKGKDSELPNVENALRTFRAGDAEHLAPENPIVFTCLCIEKCLGGAITLSQTQYAQDLKKINMGEHRFQGKIVCAKALRTTPFQGLGALIWLHQTRPDIGYDIPKLSTDDVAACADPLLARASVNLYSKTVRFVNNYPRKITYPSLRKEKRMMQSLPSTFATSTDLVH